MLVIDRVEIGLLTIDHRAAFALLLINFLLIKAMDEAVAKLIIEVDERLIDA